MHGDVHIRIRGRSPSAPEAVTVTVPVTWRPFPLVPMIQTSASSPSTAHTVPVNTIVSPG